MAEEMTMRKVLGTNLTLVVALVVVMVSVGLLMMGKLEPVRAYTAIVFASCLAAHSFDQERRYQREIIRALEAAAEVGAKIRTHDGAGVLAAVNHGWRDVAAELAEDAGRNV